MTIARIMQQAAAGGGVAGVGAWDLSYAYYDDPNAFDVSTASASGLKSIYSQATVPLGGHMSLDGTKMYIIEASTDSVHEYTLSAPFDVTSATFIQSFSVNAQETSPQDVTFKPDGTKMYVVGNAGDDVNEYDLSTAWDISTASYLQNFSISAQQPNPDSIVFKPDGTKMYIAGTSGDEVSEYDLSTPWDVSSASYLQGFAFTNPYAVGFNSDGTKMLVGISGVVHEYDLSTAWDVSSASFVQSTGSLLLTDTGTTGMFFSPNGMIFVLLIAISTSNSYVRSFVTGGFSVAAQEGNPLGLSFKPDGTKMYVIGSFSDAVNEYDLSAAWDVSSASYLQNFSVAAQDTSPSDVFFKPDGTKMYVLGYSADAVSEYDLSTPWDVSSASYLQNFSVAAQETSPQGLFFKPDGTKMYVLGSTGDDVNEYDLSTAWDVSSASYLQNFSVAAQETSPQGIFFKPDGTKMYVIGSTGDDVNEYDLSTAWDVSSASYLQNFSVAAQETSPRGFFFKDDGTQMFICDSSSDSVYSYTLGPQT